MRKMLLLAAACLLFVGQLLAQKTITGTVTDDKGNPLSGVSVLAKGTSTGTVTRTDGTYSLSVPSGVSQLEFSSIGFGTQTVNLGSSSVYSVTLSAGDNKSLDEVVVTGITRSRRSEFAGASTKIDEKLIRNQPVGSFDQLLQGRTPGVLGLTGSGAPGSATTVIIRGQGSIQGGSSPLYIVDGIAVEAGVFQNLNPNDFASIDILRDASSTALYGSRGSAGVIVITTKRGTAGKMKLSYSGQLGTKSAPDFAFRPMTTPELLAAQEAYGSIVGGPGSATIPGWYYSKNNPRYAALTPAGQAQADHLLDSISQINTNWADYIFRNGTFSNHQLSVSGGSGKTRIYSSVGLYNEQGITARTDMKRATFRNNLDYADEKLTLSVSSNIGYTKRNFQQSTTTNSTQNPFLAVNINTPYAKVFNPDGTYATGNGAKFVGANNLQGTALDQNYNDQIKITTGITAAYKITDHVTAAMTSGVDFRETQGTLYQSPLAQYSINSTTPTSAFVSGAWTRPKNGGYQESLTRFFTANVRPSITYRNRFADKHDVEVSAFGEYVTEMNKFFNVFGSTVDVKRPGTPATLQQSTDGVKLDGYFSGAKSRNTIMSGMGIAKYTYDNKYTFTGSYRYDGSSKLPKDTRWQGFYSVGGIWEMSRENFLLGNRIINTMRLRASYGGSGNANNFPGGDFPYLATYTQGSYNPLTTIEASAPGNPLLKWEKTYVANIGLDFELLNRRIYGSLDVYDKRTKDLFVSKTLSAVSGFASVDVNAGELQNKGFEWNISFDVIKNRELTWTLFTNGAYNKNKVLSLGGEPSYETGTELITVGLPLGSHYEVKWGGVDAATGAPLYYTKDGKLTTVYNASDAVQEYGTWESPWKGGFGTSLRYKGFDFSMLFSWQRGANKSDNLEFFVENLTSFLAAGYNQSADINFWKKPGDIASTPSPLYATNFSSKIIHDASFLRFRDITLSYTFQKEVIDRIKFISNLRVYAQGSNLFMWTKWRGMDPEAGATNINLSEFPNPRAFTFGLDVTF